MFLLNYTYIFKHSRNEGQDDDKTLNLTEIKSSSSLRYRPISLYCTIRKVFTTLNIFSSLLFVLWKYKRVHCIVVIVLCGMHAYKRYNKLKLLISKIYFILICFAKFFFRHILHNIYVIRRKSHWFGLEILYSILVRIEGTNICRLHFANATSNSRISIGQIEWIVLMFSSCTMYFREYVFEQWLIDMMMAINTSIWRYGARNVYIVCWMWGL